MKYEIVFLVDNFKNYEYKETLKEALEFSKTVDALKIMKNKKVVKEFKNGQTKKNS